MVIHIIIERWGSNTLVSTKRPGPTRNGSRYPRFYPGGQADEALLLHPPPLHQDDIWSRAVSPVPCSQSSRFERIAFGSGVFFFLALLKFPVIRIQPGFRRVGLSGALSFGIYSYINSIADEMKVKRSKKYKTQSKAHTASNWSPSRLITESPSDYLRPNQLIINFRSIHPNHCIMYGIDYWKFHQGRL